MTTIPAPPHAAHLDEWELTGDERIAQRWYHCGNHTTPSGVVVQVHSVQYVDGSVDAPVIAIDDPNGRDSVEFANVTREDIDHLIAALHAATGQLPDPR